MNIALIVTDMDGTLLDAHDRISAANKQMLMTYQERGTRVILASGRGYLRLLPYMQELQLERYDGMLIESNGAALYSPKRKQRTVFAQMTKAEAERLCTLFAPYGTEIQIYFDCGVYYYIPQALMKYKEKEREERGLPKDYPWMGGPWSWVNDTRQGYPDQKRIHSFTEIPAKHINKLNLTADADTITALQATFQRILPNDYAMVRTCARMIEIAPQSVSKGAALRDYMEKAGIAPSEVVVFGDGENDISMFQQAQYAIAMGNASDTVKQQASAVTKSNLQDGVAAYLDALQKGMEETI